MCGKNRGDFGIPLADALIHVSQDLALGADAPGENLMRVILGDTVIGHLLYPTDTASRSTFIKDFHVLPPSQSKGCGTAAVTALKRLLKRQGSSHSRWGFVTKSHAAYRLYPKFGFLRTGMNIAKTL